MNIIDKEKILKRISTFLGVDSIVEKLAAMSPKDLQSLLLYVYEQRTQSWSVRDILGQMRQNRFVRSSGIPQRTLILFDSLAYSVLPNTFLGIELSPLAPFGSNSVLARINQKNVMSTVRNVEVIADLTIALALECAIRREGLLRLKLSGEDIKLATSQRNVRLQNFDEIPGFKAHFKIFSLATAGEARGNNPLGDNNLFEKETLYEHLVFHLILLDLLRRNGYWLDDIVVYISDIRITESFIKQFNLDRRRIGRETQNPDFNFLKQLGIELPLDVVNISDLPQDWLRSYKIGYFVEDLKALEDNVVVDLRKRFPNIKFFFDLQRVAGIGYYSKFCFKITALNKDGVLYPLSDGGCTDWTQRLLASKKERFFVSGIGTEILCQNFLDKEKKE